MAEVGMPSVFGFHPGAAELPWEVFHTPPFTEPT